MSYKLESRSVQFSPVQSLSHVRPHGLKPVRLPCPSPAPRVKIGKRNISTLRYADETTLMAESKEELKNRLMRVKEEIEKGSLKLNIKKKKTKLRIWHPVPLLLLLLSCFSRV